MIDIIDRKSARDSGLTRYFTGKPCKHGHVDERLVSNGLCAECLRAWKRDNRHAVNAAQRVHRAKNPEQWRSYKKKAYLADPEKFRAEARERARKNADRQRENARRYAKENREHVARRKKEYNKRPETIKKRQASARRRLKDPKNNLSNRIRCGVWNTLKGGKGGQSWLSLVAFSLDDLVAHLEAQFLPGMGWHNMGDWHIDHIIPIASFNYSSADDPEFKACWDLPNLRPIWAEENRAKHAKIEFLL